VEIKENNYSVRKIDEIMKGKERQRKIEKKKRKRDKERL
jgi:hypothetical protein